MANIAEYLKQILSARYGKDVRQSIHDSIKEINDIATGAQSSATSAANTAISKANEAVSASENAAAKAEEALEAAEQAKEAAQTASEVTDIHYANKGRAGIVKPQDIYVDQTDGSMAMITHTDSPTLYNSYPGGVKLNELGGVSEQDSTTGAQLYDVNQYSGSIAIDADGWCTLSYDNSASSSATTVFMLTPNSDLLNVNTQYAVIAEVESITNMELRPISVSTTSAKGQFSDGVTVINKTGTRVIIATTRDAFDGCTSMLRTYISVNAGAVGSIKFRISVIADTTVTADTFVYEKFTGGQASPNPDYPQEIKSVVVSEINGHGTQLFDGVLELGTLSNTTGGISSSTQAIRSANYIEVTGGSTITCSNDKGYASYIYEYNAKREYLGYSTGSATKTLTLRVDTKYIKFRSKESTYENDLSVKYMVNEGSEALPWQPYQSLSVTLSDKFVLNGPNGVRDRFVRKDGVWGVERKFAEVVFDGSDDENWGVNSAYPTTTRSIVVPFLKRDGVLLSNKYINKRTYGTVDGIWAVGSLNITDMRYDTIEEFVASLVANPIEVLYETSEPTFEPLPTADQITLNSLVSFEGVTYLSCDSEIQPTWDLEYGTSKVGALMLENSNLHSVSEILRSEHERQTAEHTQRIKELETENEELKEQLEECLTTGDFTVSGDTLILNFL